jgi:ElaB protein
MNTRVQPNSQAPIARDFQNVVDDAHELLKTVQSEGESKISDVRSKVQDSLEVARAKVGAVGSQVQQTAKQAAVTTDEYVRANPWQAVGVGALAGALVGFLIARR